uniref:EF-hand domain-containing protein n=1 Tax=Glossina austeni TaxID=7395 RepID=A0A1A9UTT4_GLOAU
MEMIGEPLNEQQLTQLLAIADLDQDGLINYDDENCERCEERSLEVNKGHLTNNSIAIELMKLVTNSPPVWFSKSPFDRRKIKKREVIA